MSATHIGIPSRGEIPYSGCIMSHLSECVWQRSTIWSKSMNFDSPVACRSPRPVESSVPGDSANDDGDRPRNRSAERTLPGRITRPVSKCNFGRLLPWPRGVMSRRNRHEARSGEGLYRELGDWRSLTGHDRCVDPDRDHARTVSKPTGAPRQTERQASQGTTRSRSPSASCPRLGPSQLRMSAKTDGPFRPALPTVSRVAVLTGID